MYKVKDGKRRIKEFRDKIDDLMNKPTFKDDIGVNVSNSEI